MRKGIMMGLLAVLLTCMSVRIHAQTQEIEQLLLNIEKLAQFKKILQGMYDGYKILEEGYNKVKGIAEGNFKLHQLFLDGLMAVNPEIKKYYKVAEIIQYQTLLVKEYKSAFSMFSSCKMFNPKELEYIGRVYKDLFNESVSNLDALLTVVTAGTLRMSDDERLEAIDAIYREMDNKLSFLRQFNKSTHILALQRLKETGELQGLEKLHGIK